jgi:outer membrane protein assembly factor BamA
VQKRITVLLLILFFAIDLFAQNLSGVAERKTLDSVFVPEGNMLIDSNLLKKKSKLGLFIKKVLDGELNWNFVITPLAAYQPETNWSFGMAGAYYLKSKKIGGRTGSIGFNASYTLNKQFNFNILSTIYFDKNQKWFLYSNVGFKHYPDNFYGIGNHPDNLLSNSFSYNSDNFYFTAQPQMFFKGNWIAGINLALRWENAFAGTNNLLGKTAMIEYSIKGFEKYFMLGYGGVLSYDSRDNLFYPNKGIFFKGVVTDYKQIFGSSYQMVKAQVDFRQYIPLYKEFILAWQFFTEWTFADEKPFQMLSTIGGLEMLRGVRLKMWNDDVSAVVQAELRIPVYSIFKAAVFAGIGDVYNLSSWQFAKPKIAYGIGLRVKFNKSKAHIRFDAARQNYDNSFSYYITVNEAF